MCGSDLLKKLLSPQKFTFDLQLQIVLLSRPRLLMLVVLNHQHLRGPWRIGGALY